MNNVKVPMDKQAYNTSRKRREEDPQRPADGVVSKNFGLNISIDRSMFPKQDANWTSGNPNRDGSIGSKADINALRPGNQEYREVIPPGEIGSEETFDPQLPPTQHVDTVEHYEKEDKDPELHNPVKALRSADRGIRFYGYKEFQPRTSPIPRTASDEGFLEGPAQLSADPLMTDVDSFKMLIPRDARRYDLYGENRAGMLHNEGSAAHPGFQAVQSKIASKQGISQERAGAILAASSRGASKAAKKANPRLKRVKG